MSMSYQEMAEDVLRFADSKQIEAFSLLGHNLGAKVAMHLACAHPTRVTGLISLDTAPKSFVGDKQNVQATLDNINKIKKLDIQGKTKKTALTLIEKNFPSPPGIANFIAANLVYDDQATGGDKPTSLAGERKFVKWCVNMDAIILNYDSIIGFDVDSLKPYEGPALFINGSVSVKHEEEVFRKLFPHCQIEVVEGAGHYVHTDKPLATAKSISKFLKKIEAKKL